MPINDLMEIAREFSRKLQGVGASHVWLTGSLSEERAIVGSDIDIHACFGSDTYKGLIDDNTTVLQCFTGCHVSVNAKSFIRLLTQDGLVIDFSFYEKGSSVQGRYCNSIKILLGEKPLPVVSSGNDDFIDTADKKTDSECDKLGIDLLVVLAAVPSMLNRGEIESALFQLDLLRVELINIIYNALGYKYATKYKHFREIFPPETLSEILATYPVSATVTRPYFIYIAKLIFKYLVVSPYILDTYKKVLEKLDE